MTNTEIEGKMWSLRYFIDINQGTRYWQKIEYSGEKERKWSHHTSDRFLFVKMKDARDSDMWDSGMQINRKWNTVDGDHDNCDLDIDDNDSN